MDDTFDPLFFPAGSPWMTTSCWCVTSSSCLSSSPSTPAAPQGRSTSTPSRTSSPYWATCRPARFLAPKVRCLQVPVGTGLSEPKVEAMKVLELIASLCPCSHTIPVCAEMAVVLQFQILQSAIRLIRTSADQDPPKARHLGARPAIQQHTIQQRARSFVGERGLQAQGGGTFSFTVE